MDAPLWWASPWVCLWLRLGMVPFETALWLRLGAMPLTGAPLCRASFWVSLWLRLGTLLSPLWPPRPLESKVIQIQSDHPPAFSPPVAAMERSKVICSIQVWGRDVGLSSKVSLDFAGLGSPLALEPPFSSSYLMLLFYTDDLLTFEMDKSTWWLRVWFPSSAPPSLFFRRASGWLSEGTTLSSSPIFFPPCAAPFSQVPLGRILHALGMTFAMPIQWGPLTVSLASHLLDIFFYSGLAGPRYLLEKNFWEESECRLAACPRPLFHAVSPSPGLVKLPRALQPTGMR